MPDIPSNQGAMDLDAAYEWWIKGKYLGGMIVNADTTDTHSTVTGIVNTLFAEYRKMRSERDLAEKMYLKGVDEINRLSNIVEVLESGCAQCQHPQRTEKAEAEKDELKAYRQAVDDALVVSLDTVTTGDAKADLHKLLTWEVQVALDPKVSKAAADLARQEFRRGIIRAHEILLNLGTISSDGEISKYLLAEIDEIERGEG